MFTTRPYAPSLRKPLNICTIGSEIHNLTTNSHCVHTNNAFILSPITVKLQQNILLNSIRQYIMQYVTIVDLYLRVLNPYPVGMNFTI